MDILIDTTTRIRQTRHGFDAGAPDRVGWEQKGTERRPAHVHPCGDLHMRLPDCRPQFIRTVGGRRVARLARSPHGYWLHRQWRHSQDGRDRTTALPRRRASGTRPPSAQPSPTATTTSPSSSVSQILPCCGGWLLSKRPKTTRLLIRARAAAQRNSQQPQRRSTSAIKKFDGVRFDAYFR